LGVRKELKVMAKKGVDRSVRNGCGGRGVQK